MTPAPQTRRTGRRTAAVSLPPVCRCLAGRQRMAEVTDPMSWDHPGQPILGDTLS